MDNAEMEFKSVWKDEGIFKYFLNLFQVLYLVGQNIIRIMYDIKVF